MEYRGDGFTVVEESHGTRVPFASISSSRGVWQGPLAQERG